MKIVRIAVYSVPLPYKSVSRLTQGRPGPSTLDSTIVTIETDEGVIGLGESCPVAAVYLPAFAATARAAIAEMAPALIGRDPRELGCINEVMDATVRGHPHAKSAIDIACWDILGQATGLPLYVLLGGRYVDEVPLVVIIPIGDPDTMVAAIGEQRREGFRTFQMKVGTGPVEDIARVRAAAAAVATDERLIIDANRGWNSEDALRVLRAIDDVDCLIEQPCGSYEACLRPAATAGIHSCSTSSSTACRS